MTAVPVRLQAKRTALYMVHPHLGFGREIIHLDWEGENPHSAGFSPEPRYRSKLGLQAEQYPDGHACETPDVTVSRPVNCMMQSLTGLSLPVPSGLGPCLTFVWYGKPAIQDFPGQCCLLSACSNLWHLCVASGQIPICGNPILLCTSRHRQGLSPFDFWASWVAMISRALAVAV